jgi:hypothetical protein
MGFAGLFGRNCIFAIGMPADAFGPASIQTIAMGFMRWVSLDGSAGKVVGDDGFEPPTLSV